MDIESVYNNGGFIGRTADFSATDFYKIDGEPATAPTSFGLYQQSNPGITDTFTVNTTGITATDTLILIYHMEAISPSNSYSSFTVDGVECTVDSFLNVQESTPAMASVAIARISGITSSSISVSVFNGFSGTRFRSALSAYKVAGDLSVIATSSVGGAATVSSITYSLNTEANGIVFFAQTLGDENDTSTWPSATELYDQAHQEINMQMSAAYYLSPSSTHSETVTYTGAINGLAGIAVSYSTSINGNRKNSGIWNLQAVLES